VAEAGIGRVVIAVEDPMWERHAREHPGGPSPERGIPILREAGIVVEVGLLRDEAIMLNAPFFKGIATGMPLVIAKWAMSVDGKIATRTGSSRWISGETSRRRVHEVRACVDAVMVGSGTALRDDPRLTCRGVEARREAARVVLCGSSAPPPDSKLVRSAGDIPVILAHRADAPPAGLGGLVEAGCESLPLPPAPGRPAAVDLRAALQALGQRDFTNVLVEGGRDVLGSLFDAHLVDRCLVFVAPLVIGGAAAVTAVGGQGAESVREAVPLLGPTRHTDDEALPAEPETLVRITGSDLLLEGWASDPRAWFSEDFKHPDSL
jgi:diaminohydroxyphosphoribosylaminopyrimidine deaminase/5-amino-6-(5-phosphoribosylamino)uracil reductase